MRSGCEAELEVDGDEIELESKMKWSRAARAGSCEAPGRRRHK